MATRNRVSMNPRFAYCGVLLAYLCVAAVVQAQNPVPLINQPLVPDAIKPGTGGFTLTVNGTGFVSGSVVNWNGNARSTTFVSKSRLTTNILSSDVAKRGTASLTVSNPAPGGGISNVVPFPITTPTSSMSFGRVDVNVGSGPDAIATGDFNKDGKLDLVVANDLDSNVSVLLGNGDGTFQSQALFATDADPDAVVVGDVNGDGNLDILVRSQFSYTISVLLGNGDGTFKPFITSSTLGCDSRMAAGDFNGDGRLDLACSSFQNKNVAILLGNGDGTLQNEVDYSLSSSGWIVVGDFNGDGKLDLAIEGTTGVSVLLGNGNGSFQTPVHYVTGGTPSDSMDAVDLNRDGILDLIVPNQNNTVSVLLGNGDGTFKPHVDYTAGPTDVGRSTLADINGDGKLDIILTPRDPSNVLSILPGNGNGGFGSATTYSTGPEPLGVVAGDFNNDGRLDIATANNGGSTVSVLLQSTAVLSNTSLQFSAQVITTSSTAANVKLTNNGPLSLIISSIAVTGSNSADFVQSNNCGSSIAPGASCTISTVFKPTVVGLRGASIAITDSAVDSPQNIILSGIGVASGPNATLSPTSLIFATQLLATTSMPQAVTITDYGTAPLSIGSIVASGDFTAIDNCGSGISVLATCTINVTFKPAQKGSRAGTLSITDNAAGNPQKVTLKGTGTVVELTPTSLGFGIHPVNTSTSQLTVLTNIDTTSLSIYGISIKGTNPGDFSETNTCGTSVVAAASCNINVTFTPKTIGLRSAYLAISDNGGGSPQQVPLAGTGCVYNNKYHRCITAPATLNTAKLRSMFALSLTSVVPAATGINRIGTRILDFIDTSRDDPFLANGTKRELLVRFWYPASLDQSCQSAQYTSVRVWSHFAELTGLPLPKVSTNSCLDASITNAMHPIVVFTHGYTGTFTDYTFLFEDLASRGYVVVSIDHTYEATAVEFPNGHFVKSLVGSHLNDTWRTDDKTLSFVLSVRAKDLTFILNELERLNTTAGNPFSGKLDTSRIALMGHSLGGQATISSLQQESRFKVGVILDGALNSKNIERSEKPVLLLAAGRDHWTPGECQFWDSLTGPRLAVDLKGAEHLALSDAVWLAKGFIKTGDIGPEGTIAAVRDYVARFLEANLEDNPPDTLFSGPSRSYHDAIVTPRQQPLCDGTQALR